MSRWHSTRLTPAPRSTCTDPMDSRPLSPGEVQRKRLELCEELLGLVARDGVGLPAPTRQELLALCTSVGKLRRRARTL